MYFSRSLSFSYHINCYLKENFERKFNYMIKLLGEHGTFTRISFGDALWNSVLRPSISHGCTVWMPSALSSKGMLETCQYKAAKLIFSTNMTIPKSALFLELGWEPQALVSFKKYMPPPLPYFKVNICPVPLPHFASIFFAYL